MIAFILATRNEHKAGEIRALLGPAFPCRILGLGEFPNAPEVVEDAVTFEGNAMKKAVELAGWLSRDGRRPLLSNLGTNATETQAFVLADDSGLEVDALNGAPGVRSARFAADESREQGNSSTAANNAKLLRLLEGVPLEKRTARFRCVIALTPLVYPRQTQQNSSPVCQADELELLTELFTRACEGRIGFEARGQGGFGYDPLFFPDGYEQTFAELGANVKNRLSHRAKALLAVRQRFLRP